MLQIKKAREALGLTQEQLATKVNVTKEYISYIENGHKIPSIALLKKIAKTLNVSVKDLMEDESA
ncbi:MAG: hypothetical protein PWP45_1364 [Tepidanaerobacteraceae bacterium]|nr:hypothetical protein [Tepidanaerobacteraceae bacterium]